MWLKLGDLKNMSRMEESSDHKKGPFSVKGCAGTRSPNSLLAVNFNGSPHSNL
jgi:hypothetical protein